MWVSLKNNLKISFRFRFPPGNRQQESWQLAVGKEVKKPTTSNKQPATSKNTDFNFNQPGTIVGQNKISSLII